MGLFQGRISKQIGKLNFNFTALNSISVISNRWAGDNEMFSETVTDLFAQTRMPIRLFTEHSWIKAPITRRISSHARSRSA